MQKINFIDNETKANADTFNTLQDNIENTLIESGSNENGSWIKYPDGTMMCTKIKTGTINMNVWTSPIIFGDISMGNWPQTFTRIDNVQATSNTDQLFTNCVGSGLTQAGTIRVIGVSSAAQSKSYNVHLTAIGRWK